MILNLTSGGTASGSSGGTGAILQVNAPAGVLVTATKESETHTRTADSQGVAVFDGLTTGTWAITISNGQQTSEPQTVKIVTDYTCYIAFFASTISVLYPENHICTCTKGDIVYTAPDQSGSATFTVPEAGDWVVSCTDAAGENRLQRTVTITEDGETVATELHFDFYIIDGAPITDEVTGGWHGLPVKRDASVTYPGAGPTVTQNTDNIKLSFADNASGIYKMQNKLDLTFVRAIEFTGNMETTSSSELDNRASLICWTEIGDYFNENVAARLGMSSIKNTYGTYTLDVSQLTGTHYIGFNLHSKYASISVYKLKVLY